jgi:hypothetical protein
MKTFTIDTDNNITAHGSRTAARETGDGAFASEEQLAELIGGTESGFSRSGTACRASHR